jgi:hypothetical protein
MKYCTKCGNEVNDSDKFCAHCGQSTGLSSNDASVKSGIKVEIVNTNTEKAVKVAKKVIAKLGKVIAKLGVSKNNIEKIIAFLVKNWKKVLGIPLGVIVVVYIIIGVYLLQSEGDEIYLVFTIPFFLLIPIYFVSKKLNDNYQISHPEDKGYIWGYFQGITIIAWNILALLWGLFVYRRLPYLKGEMRDLALELFEPSFFGVVIPIIFILIASGVCARIRGLFIIFTILTFNPVIWVINYFYIKRRPYLAKK